MAVNMEYLNGNSGKRFYKKNADYFKKSRAKKKNLTLRCLSFLISMLHLSPSQ